MRNRSMSFPVPWLFGCLPRFMPSSKDALLTAVSSEPQSINFRSPSRGSSLTTHLLSNRLVKGHGYGDCIWEPVGSAFVRRSAAYCLQVPHRGSVEGNSIV